MCHYRRFVRGYFASGRAAARLTAPLSVAIDRGRGEESVDYCGPVFHPLNKSPSMGITGGEEAEIEHYFDPVVRRAAKIAGEILSQFVCGANLCSLTTTWRGAGGAAPCRSGCVVWASFLSAAVLWSSSLSGCVMDRIGWRFVGVREEPAVNSGLQSPSLGRGGVRVRRYGCSGLDLALWSVRALSPPRPDLSPARRRRCADQCRMLTGVWFTGRW